jgi:formate dehydrogenase major subunit
VRDLAEIETRRSGTTPGDRDGELRTEDIGTEVFFLPAAAHTEKDGTFTNTQRLLQWRHKAVEPPRGLPLGPVVRLPPRPRIRESSRLDRPRDRPILELTWDYPLSASRRADAEAVLQEINGRDATARSREVPGARGDGSTPAALAARGIYADGVNQSRAKHAGASRTGSPEWAGRGRPNRILYNRASRTPTAPWSERKKYVWWDAEQGAWTSRRPPDFSRTRRRLRAARGRDRA